ncbi:site-specific integrase [Roseomonas hellenica]|uniref:Site-specific integrase n=1 Tax=Plastoroseomonas hellenica TaxID=2687306 RepID=A0ABS5F2Z4_9PROT|nr:site-specific integrase [Plastoroseomonas hellenica]
MIGKREIWISYGPVSYAKAKAMHPAEMAKIERLFATARKRIASATLRPVATLTPATLEDARACVLRWFHGQEAERLARPTPDDPIELDDALGHLNGDVADLAGEEGRRIAERLLPGILETYGFAVPQGDVRRVSVALAQRALVEGAERQRDRLSGRPERVHDAALPVTIGNPPPAPQAPGLTLGALFQAYMGAPERAGMAPKTKLKYDGFIRVLMQVLGEDTPAARVTRQDSRKAQAVLQALPPNAGKRWPKLKAPEAAEKAKREGIAPMHPNSVINHLEFLSSAFAYGVREQLVPTNPASGLNGVTTKGVAASPGVERRRRPFTEDELRLIFSAPLYAGCQDDGNGYANPGPNHPRRGRFWAPLLALFGGLRLGEACQLAVADVVTDGVPRLLIQADAEGSRLKTVTSQRVVPVHSSLVDLGFLAHVEKMRAAGEQKLFPELPVSASGNYADVFSKWFGRFLTKASVTSPRAVFHSFRHGWRDRLREAGVPREVVDALGGWATPGQSADYGSGFSVATLARHLNKISYPGLDLDHLRPQAD